MSLGFIFTVRIYLFSLYTSLRSLPPRKLPVQIDRWILFRDGVNFGLKCHYCWCLFVSNSRNKIHWDEALESFVTLVWYRFGVPPFNGVYYQSWYGIVTGNRLKRFRNSYLSFWYLFVFHKRAAVFSSPRISCSDRPVNSVWRCEVLLVLHAVFVPLIWLILKGQSGYSRSLKCHPPSLRPTPNG